MIQISLPVALIVYSALIVLGAFFIWLYTEVTTRRAYVVLEKQYLWRCVFCSYTYLDTDAVTHSTCPQCQSINTLEDKKARFVPVSKSVKAAAEAGETRATQESRRNPSRGKRPGARRRGPRKRSR